MADQPSQQTDVDVTATEDGRQLDLLALFHYVLGGLLALFGCCPVIHLVIGIVLIAGGFPVKESQPRFGHNFRDSQSQMVDNGARPADSFGEIQKQQPTPSRTAKQSDNIHPEPPRVDIRHSNGRREQVVFGSIFTVLALGMIIMAWVIAILVLLAGRNLKQRKGYTYCMIIAGVECLFMPMGTVLGVFSLIVLSRPSVKALFSQPK